MERKAVLGKRKDGEIVSLDEILTQEDLKHYAKVIYEDEIKELVETEVDEGTHSDTPEDYQTAIDFYLSNVVDDSYHEYLKTRLGRNLGDALLIAIQDLVILGIREEIL